MAEIEGPARVSFLGVGLGVAEGHTVVTAAAAAEGDLPHLEPGEPLGIIPTWDITPGQIAANLDSIRKAALEQTGLPVTTFYVSPEMAAELASLVPPRPPLPFPHGDATALSLRKAWGNRPWSEGHRLALADRLGELGLELSEAWVRGHRPWAGWRNAGEPGLTRSARRKKLKQWRYFLAECFEDLAIPF